MTERNRALFIDRDGVFNELIASPTFPGRPPNRWSEVKLFDGLEILQTFREKGILLLMVTNQPDIERGLVTRKFVDELNTFLATKYKLNQIYCCPFGSANHPDKKPNPGMLFRAAQEFSLDLPNSWFLGDTEKDTGAAKNAGCRSLIIDRPYNQTLECDRRIYRYSELMAIL